jgi:hypothetical protein
MLNENNKENDVFEIDEYLLEGGVGGVNMGFGIPPHAKTGGNGEPYMDYINAPINGEK